MTANNNPDSKPIAATPSLRVRGKCHLKRLQYVLMRHAIPLNAREREAFRNGPRIFANSIPKSGTNLLKRILHLLPCTTPRWTYQIDRNCPDVLRQLRRTRKGQLVTAHCPWAEELSEFLKQNRFRAFLIIRDLRDLALSNSFYIANKDKAHRLHAYFQTLGSDEERLSASIVGIDGETLPDGIRSKPIGEHAVSFLPWIDDPDCLLLRFEDLIGSRGGGDDTKQLEAVRAVIQHLGLSLSDAQIRDITQNTFFTGSRTFRKGQIGNWREHFTEKHKQEFKETAGEALIKMGYENDLDW